MKLIKSDFTIELSDKEIRYQLHALDHYLKSAMPHYQSLEELLKSEGGIARIMHDLAVIVSSEAYVKLMEHITKFYNEELDDETKHGQTDGTS